MQSINRVTLLGNVGRDPESRVTQDGRNVVSMAVATSETWNDKGSGERQERTTWHRIVIFNDRLGDVAMKSLRKGSKVYLEGSLQARKYTDKDGHERTVTEIVLSQYRGELVLLDARNEQQPVQANGGARAPARASIRRRLGARPSDMDDAIPF